MLIKHTFNLTASKSFCFHRLLCRLNPNMTEKNLKYCVKAYWLFGPKNQSFRNKSGKTQPIRTKFGIRGEVRRWQRSGNFGRDRPIFGKIGAGTSPAEPELFWVVIQTTFHQLCNGRFSPNLATKRNWVSRRWIREDIFENFHFRGHCPQNLKSQVGQNRYLTQSRLQVTGCTAERYCLLHVVVQGPMSFPGRSTFLYGVWLRSYGASNLPNFRILAFVGGTCAPSTKCPSSYYYFYYYSSVSLGIYNNLHTSIGIHISFVITV